MDIALSHPKSALKGFHPRAFLPEARGEVCQREPKAEKPSEPLPQPIESTPYRRHTLWKCTVAEGTSFVSAPGQYDINFKDGKYFFDEPTPR
ncbi:MAG: hypothetical protein WAO98_00130 [Alphaproteobacteria bacterium]